VTIDAQAAQVSVAVSDLDALVVLVDHLTERVDSAFAEGYSLGYEGGYDHGEVQAELDMARAHAATVRAVREIDKPDDWESRVRSAEAHGHALALRQWSARSVWTSVMEANPGLAVAIAGLAGRP
jgi:hypothetical protein